MKEKIKQVFNNIKKAIYIAAATAALAIHAVYLEIRKVITGKEKDNEL